MTQRTAENNRSEYSRRSQDSRYTEDHRRSQDSRYPEDHRRAERYPEDHRSSGRRPVRRRKKKKHGGLIAVIIILVLLIAAGVWALKSGIFNKNVEVADTRPLPAYPEVIEEVTVAATGDILLHAPILNTVAYNGYDFSGIFSEISEYYSEADLMIANLEVPLGGEEYGYSSYPTFNSPDTIAYNLKNAGVDMCLTANNHANDMGYSGMMRTLDVLDEAGLEHLGTRKSEDENYLVAKNINGVKLGMICYTYDTREYTDWQKSLNGITMSDDGAARVNSFSYSALDEFYADAQEQIDHMDMLGVDVKIFFMHWGNEYQDYPCADQENIAQQLCEMGVDVIIGGHPHVVQEFDVLESSSGHETICLYSMGNELSNQRRDLMQDEDGGRGYTEDGLIIQVTISKFNNGRCKVSGVDIIPTWVYYDGYEYRIVALDPDTDPYSWNYGEWYFPIESYNRTMGRVGDEYNEYRLNLGQSAVDEYID